MAIGLLLAQSMYNLHTAAVAEEQRIRANEAMAAAFDEVDFVIAATNPGPAFAADGADEQPVGELHRLGQVEHRSPGSASARCMGGVRLAGAAVPQAAVARCSTSCRSASPISCTWAALTIISNIYGNPAVSIPGGHVDGLPVGMQVLARHHADELLFDVALAVERETPWPTVAEQAGG